MSQVENAGCSRVRSRLELLQDGALPPLEEALDRGHLEACTVCAREAARWTRVWRGIRELSRPEPGELARSTTAALSELCEAEQRERAPRGRRIPVALVAAAAAILALLALELSGAGLGTAPEVKDLTAFEQALERLPSWSELVRGLESLSRRLS